MSSRADDKSNRGIYLGAGIGGRKYGQATIKQ